MMTSIVPVTHSHCHSPGSTLTQVRLELHQFEHIFSLFSTSFCLTAPLSKKDYGGTTMVASEPGGLGVPDVRITLSGDSQLPPEYEVERLPVPLDVSPLSVAEKGSIDCGCIDYLVQRGLC